MNHTTLSAVLMAAASLAPTGEVVLFDAASTPLSQVGPQAGGEYALRDGVLEIRTRGGAGYPGVVIRGAWDLSGCRRITLELANLDTQGDLPITVRLDNPDADPGAARGVFVDRVTIAGATAKAYRLDLPPELPHGREISRRLTGMRRSPLATTGVVADLDPAQVVAVAVYIKEPKLNWRWGVRRIVAEVGPPMALPDWMRLTPEAFFPFIDRYGQFRYKDWPGKIHADADLQAARAREAADLQAHPGPADWNRFGGWASGPRRPASGHFRVEKLDGLWWLVDPEGCLYWSHGPVRVTSSTAITPLDGRESYFAELPPADSPLALFYTTRDELLHPSYVKRHIQRTYDFSSANVYRKYGEDWFDTFADLAHRRLRSWGMNTIANSSDRRICRLDRTPYTDRFELKSRSIAASRDSWWPFRDPFDPSFRADVSRQMREHQEEMDDPWCFGFFVDNELAWGGPTDLAAWTLASPPDQPAKREFMARLQKQYPDLAALNRAWGTAYADWDAFLAATHRPGAGADADLAAFTLAIAEAYFQNVRAEFKAAAPHKLYLGCRFAGRGPEFALRVAARYCDLLSFNIYARSLDDFRLPAGIDLPVLIGEFHFGALDRGLFHPGLIRLQDQDERGRTYTQYVTSALRHPQVVGVHWHQFGDQATTGRFDGENFQVGLVDGCDTPYVETIAGSRAVGYRLYELRHGARPAATAQPRPGQVP